MPLPDKYADEPVVELDKDKVTLWRNAQDAADQWQAHADALKRELISMVGANHAGTVDGQKVITYRPMNKYAEARIRDEYPDLVRHYLVERLETRLDMQAFARQHADVAERYRVRQFRFVEET